MPVLIPKYDGGTLSVEAFVLPFAPSSCILHLLLLCPMQLCQNRDPQFCPIIPSHQWSRKSHLPLQLLCYHGVLVQITVLQCFVQRQEWVGGRLALFRDLCIFMILPSQCNISGLNAT